MKQIIQRSIMLTAIAVLAVSTLTITASAAKSKHFDVYGRILSIDQKARTALVADRWSEKLYQIYMPEGATVRIVFGQNMRLSAAEFEDLHKNDRIQARVERAGTEHLSQLEDGRQVIVVSAVK